MPIVELLSAEGAAPLLSMARSSGLLVLLLLSLMVTPARAQGECHPACAGQCLGGLPTECTGSCPASAPRKLDAATAALARAAVASDESAKAVAGPQGYAYVSDASLDLLANAADASVSAKSEDSGEVFACVECLQNSDCAAGGMCAATADVNQPPLRCVADPSSAAAGAEGEQAPWWTEYTPPEDVNPVLLRSAAVATLQLLSASAAMLVAAAT